MYALAVVGTILVIPAGVLCWLLAAREFAPGLWEYASATGYVIVAIAWGPVTVPLAAQSIGAAIRFFIPALFYGCLYAVACQMVLEQFVELPKEIEPLPDRWPEWIQRGFEG